ncbi:MAG: C39 family peptidase [Oscillospiraceae bacterium]|nr:C39 family peptidase [Oscillospiraceae bacterium]
MQRSPKRFLCLLLAAAMVLPAMTHFEKTEAFDGTVPNGQTVGSVLLYMTDGNGDQVLAAQVSLEELYGMLLADESSFPVYNYSAIDAYKTPVHQEARGFTVEEFVSYMVNQSSDSGIQDLGLSYSKSSDSIAFWSMDETDFKEENTYTYAELYETTRYNFPALYECWDYLAQKYTDKERVWESREEVPVILSIDEYSERYFNMIEKYYSDDYHMENYFYDNALLDTQRSVRLMMGQTEDAFDNQTATATASRFWICDILLDTAQTHEFTAMGSVSAPTYYVVDGDTDPNYEDGYYYVFLESEAGATLYYNNNFQNPTYMPTVQYAPEEPIRIEKAYTSNTNGYLTTFRAVRDGYTDAGVQGATLTDAIPNLLVDSSSYSADDVSIPLSYCYNMADWFQNVRLTLDGRDLTADQFTRTTSAAGQEYLTLDRSLFPQDGSYTLTAEYRNHMQTVEIALNYDYYVPQYIDIEYVSQGDKNWCWAASALMAGKAITPASTITLEDVVRKIKGDTLPDTSGTNAEIVRAAEYASEDKADFSASNYTRSWEYLYKEISKGHPVIAICRTYNSGPLEPPTRHAVVIVGCYIDDTDAKCVQYLDPDQGSEPKKVAYDSFSSSKINSWSYIETILVDEIYN